MPRPLRGQQQPTLYMCSEFEKRLRNIESVAKFRNWVMSPRPGPLRGNLQSVNKNCLSVCLYVSLSVERLLRNYCSNWVCHYATLEMRSFIRDEDMAHFLSDDNWRRDLDLWPFNLESGVRVSCDVGYLCANFSHPRSLCSRHRPDVRDRQTDRRQTDRQTSDSIIA